MNIPCLMAGVQIGSSHEAGPSPISMIQAIHFVGLYV